LRFVSSLVSPGKPLWPAAVRSARRIELAILTRNPKLTNKIVRILDIYPHARQSEREIAGGTLFRSNREHTRAQLSPSRAKKINAVPQSILCVFETAGRLS
jgi:hypothetical protein